MFWYMLDDSEQTGVRSWNSIRNLRIWNSSMNPVDYTFINEKTSTSYIKDQRKLYIVIGNVTNMGLIHGFGLHGGVFKNLDICYALPWVLFKVPVLREFLMWTGAVSIGHLAHINDSIMSILDKGKALCVSINGMNGILHDKVCEIDTIDDVLFEFLKSENIHAVPVLINNEHSRYSIYKSSYHNFFIKTFGFPFPFFFNLKLGEDAPPKLRIDIGVPVNVKRCNSIKDFNRLFFNQIKGEEIV